jgi:hypothetical protein
MGCDVDIIWEDVREGMKSNQNSYGKSDESRIESENRKCSSEGKKEQREKTQAVIQIGREKLVL